MQHRPTRGAVRLVPDSHRGNRDSSHNHHHHHHHKKSYQVRNARPIRSRKWHTTGTRQAHDRHTTGISEKRENEVWISSMRTGLRFSIQERALSLYFYSLARQGATSRFRPTPCATISVCSSHLTSRLTPFLSAGVRLATDKRLRKHCDKIQKI